MKTNSIHIRIADQKKSAFKTACKKLKTTYTDSITKFVDNMIRVSKEK